MGPLLQVGFVFYLLFSYSGHGGLKDADQKAQGRSISRGSCCFLGDL